jgi:peptidyl-dipeptidase Dcp
MSLFPSPRLPVLLSVLLCAAGGLSAETAAMSPNPLLTPSPLPYELPPFELIKDEHFVPAFEAGMAEELREVEAITANPAAPSFDNTIVALERRGATLARAQRAFSILKSSLTNPTLQKIDTDMAPRLSAHDDSIKLNHALFTRVKAVHDRRESLGLDAEALRLVERHYRDFVRAGALLPEGDKSVLKALNAELATLSAQFGTNLLKESNASAVLVDTREELAGLDENTIAAAAAAAKAAGHAGRYLVTLTNTSGQPALAELSHRPTREKIMAASLARGGRGGEFDTRALAARMAKLRAERAALLGYPHHAAYQLEEQTIGNVDVLNRLLAQAAPLAAANARREAADMQKVIDATGAGHALAAADWAFYAEKVRAARYAFDENQLKPYYEMKRVLEDGVFYASTRLYGITYKARPDLKGYTDDMLVYEVFDHDGQPLALLLADLYARPSKRGGAWMNAYVPQNGLTGAKPVIGIHQNIPKPPAGQPTLLTHDEVNTLFHEFGHALHGMFSAVKYPRFAGTQVPRDFVEFPSQVNEMWATWPEVLMNYARHYQTGEPIPQALLDKIAAAAKFNQGFATSEYLGATLIDQAWHQLKPDEVPGADGVLDFEAAALRKAGLDFAPVPPRYRTPYFQHIFVHAYSAGYYSYFWSEVLDAQTVEWMKRHGGLTRANGDRFRSALLSRGGSREALAMFREFSGEEPDVRPLFARRGLETGAP